LAKQYNINFLETSAKDTVNIDELFINTTKTYIEKQSIAHIKRDTKKHVSVKSTAGDIIIDNPITIKKKKSGCC
jgi:hypothetical protein